MQARRALRSSEAGGRAGVSGAALVIISAVSYGTVPIVAKYAFASGVSLPAFLAWRFSIAAALLWVAALATRGGLPTARRVGGLLLLGAIGYAGQSAAYFFALARMPASATALLLYTYPSLVTLGAAAFLRERIDGRKLGAVAIAFAGTTLIVGGHAGGLSSAGVGFALLSAVIYSAYILFGSKLFDGPSPVASAATVMTATAASFTIGAIVTKTLAVPALGPQAAFTGLAAVVGTAVPVLAFLTGMPKVGPARASILSTLEPVVTVALAALLLAEPLSPLQVAGAACVLASVLVLEAGRANEWM